MATAKSNDKKTEQIFQTIENIRSSTAGYSELAKAASAYQKQLLKLTEAGRTFVESLQKVAALQGGDINDGITKFAELHKTVETKRDAVAKSLLDELVNNLQRNLKQEESDVNQFESDFKKARINAKQQIAKLEQASKKAGKKGTESLQQSITVLNDKIKEAEQMKSDKLRQILLFERKKYCTLLASMGNVLSAENDYWNETLNKGREIEGPIKTVASSSDRLPTDMEDLITSQQRTFVALQTSDEYSYAEGYNDYSSYDNYDTGADASNGYDSYGGSGGASSAVALYDYAGQHDGDLSFYAGEIITVTQEDLDGSGWLTGTLNGVSGIFPASYVQRQ